MTCRPGCSQSAISTGSRAGVAVTTSWLSATSLSGSPSARASMPRLAARSAAHACRLRRVAAPDENPPERPHQMRRLDLQPRLDAGADDARRGDGARREVAGRDGAGRRRADVGEVAVVEEQRVDEAGLRREQDHQPVEARQAELRVVEEARAHLDREAVEAGDVGRLHVDLAVRLRDRHRQDRRHHDAARGERGEGPLDRVDRLEVEADRLAEIGFRRDQDVMRHGRELPRSSGRRASRPAPSRRA